MIFMHISIYGFCLQSDSFANMFGSMTYHKGGLSWLKITTNPWLGSDILELDVLVATAN